MEDARATDRVYLEIPIECLGQDLLGMEFSDQGQTVSLSRRGATIILNQKLAPGQEITVRNLKNSREASARIVAHVSPEGTENVYGITFLDSVPSIWDIEFPSRTGSEEFVGRTLLECGACHNREIVYLEEQDAEVFQKKRQILRTCGRCGDRTLWKHAQHETSAAPTPEKVVRPPERPPIPPSPPRDMNERKHLRVGLKFVACIRYMGWTEEVLTENVSRGGFAFKSRKSYFVGGGAEVAMPFSANGGNIFTRARFVNARKLPDEDATLYGVRYEKVSLETWGR